MGNVRVAVVGIGNCASSLVQGIAYYAGREQEDIAGLMHPDIGGWKPGDLQIVAAFDIDVLVAEAGASPLRLVRSSTSLDSIDGKSHHCIVWRSGLTTLSASSSLMPSTSKSRTSSTDNSSRFPMLT